MIKADRMIPEWILTLIANLFAFVGMLIMRSSESMRGAEECGS